MSISIESVETKKKELVEQFNTLNKQLKELEQASIKVKADAQAVNGAIQVCDQLLLSQEAKEDVKDES